MEEGARWWGTVSLERAVPVAGTVPLTRKPRGRLGEYRAEVSRARDHGAKSSDSARSPRARDQQSRPLAQSPTSPSAPLKGLENMPSRRSAVAGFEEILRELDAGIGYAVRVAGCDPRGRYSPHASRIRTARNRVALHLGSASQVAQTSPPHPSPVTSSSLRPPFSRLFGPETPLRAGTPSAGRRPSGSTPTAGREAQAGRDTFRISAVRRSQPTASARPCRRTTTRIH